MKIDFDPKTHRYMANGVILPSVTTICRFLNYDYKSAQPWLAETAAQRGTTVHEACALIDYEEELEEEPEIAGYLAAYRRFLRDYCPDWAGVERPLASLEQGFAGTPDRWGTIRGARALLDIKTGSVLRIPALSAQLWGYAALLAEAGFLPSVCYGLRLDKSGVYDLTLVDPSYPLFSSCYAIHQELTKERKS